MTNFDMVRCIKVFGIFFCSLLGSGNSNAQSNDDFSRNWLSAGLAYSRNTFYFKGDFGGIMLSANYNHMSSNGRWLYKFGIAGTVHDGVFSIRYQDVNDVWRDGEIHHMTGGLQGGMEFGYNIVRKKGHLLTIGLGPMLRYQVNTFPYYGLYDFYSYIYFAQSRYARSIAIGATGSISYAYFFKNGFVVQAIAGLQYDSYNDSMNISGLSIGKTLSKSNKQ